MPNLNLLPLALLLAAAQPLPAAEHVDFSYAFAPPHRLTIALPSASEKTLLDLEPGQLTASWTYEDLRTVPLSVWKPPRIAWRIRIQPRLDSKPFASSRWTRGGDSLPQLDNLYQDSSTSLRIEAIGAKSAALFRLTLRNNDTKPHRFSVLCEHRGGWVASNPAFITPGSNPDTLVAGQQERPDRLLLFALGAQSYAVGRITTAPEWTLAPGAIATGWLIRPYANYEADLPTLRRQDWQQEFTRAQSEWTRLLARATRLRIPDPGVQSAFNASLGDLFIMREPLANGYMGGIPGSDIYRSSNPWEPCLSAIAFDQLSLHPEAADGLRVHIDMQEPDGNWPTPKAGPTTAGEPPV